ncbi:MAG: FAD-dependent thymidylate synthase [Lachnospiraceae bacterium]|nr:FAD-dependent thymidylate synthase [Lachnospiraceae bacterium]
MAKVTIISETPKNPITLVGERAGVCWGADISDKEKNYKRGLDCIESGHHRVLEYVNVEMILDGYSARVIREWYTHIGGAPTRLQASTRYINYKNFEYVIPPTVEKNEEAKTLYTELMQQIADTCSKLEAECGVPREDAAMLLPLGMGTKIVDKRNVRNLIEMSHQRLCTRAYWEYRRLMQDIMKELEAYSEEWAYLVKHYFMPKCEVAGYCIEKKCCGRKPRLEK